jgi:hypothetical protein
MRFLMVSLLSVPFFARANLGLSSCTEIIMCVCACVLVGESGRGMLVQNEFFH